MIEVVKKEVEEGVWDMVAELTANPGLQGLHRRMGFMEYERVEIEGLTWREMVWRPPSKDSSV